MNPGSFDLGLSTSVSVMAVLTDLMLSGVLSTLVAWHFTRYGSTFSNRSKFARVLPPIALTTTLLICVVKSSLALSLGLVGALSIVRFRTPVKEPEELAYLFMAIAVGVGTGAGQRVLCAAAIVLILILLALRAHWRRGAPEANLYLNIELPNAAGTDGLFRRLVDVLTEYVANLDLRRCDLTGPCLQATFYIDCKDTDTLVSLQDALRKHFPGASVTFVEQSGIPGA